MGRNQELRADKYAVSAIGDSRFLKNALVQMSILNDSMMKKGKLRSLFSTHPSIELRIRMFI